MTGSGPGPLVVPATEGPLDSRTSAVAELCAVDVAFGRVQVLRRLDLMVPSGRVVGITGRNGTGKSTLLATLATLHRPASGSHRLFGVDVTAGRGVPIDVRRRLCLVQHDAAMHPNRSVREELSLVVAVRGAVRGSVDEALAVVGLTRAADRRVRDCSQGMRRRADLARAWMCQPDLLLLDEPEAGLDPGASAAVAALVADTRARGGAVVVVGHDRRRLDALCDHVLELSSGRLHRMSP